MKKDYKETTGFGYEIWTKDFNREEENVLLSAIGFGSLSLLLVILAAMLNL